jgi:hypothetical protein
VKIDDDEEKMEFLTFLIILGLVLIGIKVLGLLFKAGIALISIPFQILGAVVVAAVLFAVLPVTLITGLLAAVLVPLGILVPLLPFLIIGFGIYMLARK